MHDHGVMRNRVRNLFVKPHHGQPMVEVPELRLAAYSATADSAGPDPLSPRQVCIAVGESLDRHGVKADGARADLVVEGAEPALASGAALQVGTATVRVVFACEPCSYGARMADVPTSRFREISRYLGLVVNGGSTAIGDPVTCQPGVWESAPDSFRERCAWAVGQIPPGRLVTSVDLLVAIGASRSYLRALPRWMASAGQASKPIHRVLTAAHTAPSWSPDAQGRLAAEGVAPADFAEVRYPLSRALWFGAIPGWR
jgi:alkylated DNA nucleotide flippase Atl1